MPGEWVDGAVNFYFVESEYVRSTENRKEVCAKLSIPMLLFLKIRDGAEMVQA